MPRREKGDLSHAILRYLSGVEVHVRPRKLSPSQEKAAPIPARRLFGVPLHALPVSACADGVPQFLVDACELLRPHLHVEGLFRKTGSVTRIKALKTRLEAGENCLHMALPCDVATLVKQFLRDLPEPLVPATLQGPMYKVQQRQEEDRGPLTILLTCLFPRASASTLRYFFSFLQDVAARCSQNKMDSANLAIVFTPNLFPSELCSKLDGEAEELLKTQSAVVELLIIHASEIGIVPQSLLGEVQATFSDMECKRQSPTGAGDERRGEEESWRKRRRRRSVGDIVTEALSKFRSGRALRPAPCPETKVGACQDESLNNATLRTSFNSKRKASDDVTWNSELSTKKRRSSLESECSDFAKEEAFDKPVDAGPVPGPGSPALVFCNGVSNPVSEGTGNSSGSPRISTTKVQRRRSSCRKHPQRKHSIHTAPTPFERQNTGHKSLRVFFRGTKDPHLLSPSIMATEANSWFLAKRTVTEVSEGSCSQQRSAHLPSHKAKETKEGSLGQSSNEDSPPCTDQLAQDTAVKRKTSTGSNPSFSGASCRQQELVLNGGCQGKAEGSLGVPTEAALPLRQLRLLRRSLSWPEDLSMRDTVKQGETDSTLEEAAIDPSSCFSLADPEQPGAEVPVAGARQAGMPAVCVTLANSYSVAHLQNEPCDISDSLLSPMPDLPEDHSAQADSLPGFKKVPQSSLKRFTLNFQRASPRPNEGPKMTGPKWKGRRRFCRSVSHESGLPLRAGEEAGCAAKKAPPKSPLQSFKAYGRQIFVAHKHWALAFVGLRGRKESASRSPQETKRVPADSQECRLEGEQHRSCCSPKFPLAESRLVAGQDSPDL